MHSARIVEEHRSDSLTLVAHGMCKHWIIKSASLNPTSDAQRVEWDRFAHTHALVGNFSHRALPLPRPVTKGYVVSPQHSFISTQWEIRNRQASPSHAIVASGTDLRSVAPHSFVVTHFDPPEGSLLSFHQVYNKLRLDSPDLLANYPSQDAPRIGLLSTTMTIHTSDILYPHYTTVSHLATLRSNSWGGEASLHRIVQFSLLSEEF